ncbi:MAG: glycoside hydrolase family 127 protein [Kiritimatiellae bacterium]|nr:glycoside hydrolase family 127 protein [Kiritimatiellia bacterium]
MNNWKSKVVSRVIVCGALIMGIALDATADGLLKVADGAVSRTLDNGGGKLLGRSYKTADGTEFMRNGSPEFAFRVDGKMYAGWSEWKDVAVAKNKAKDGSCTVTVTGVSADGSVGIELAYTTYPGLALVRKTLAVVNKTDKKFCITDVDVETFRLATLGCINSRVMRRFARYREEGSVYIGDWNDPLVVVHDYSMRCGIAVGNEGVSTMKRTTAFQDGCFIVSGTPHTGERYPFSKRLRPGEKWTAMPVFTAPYSKCADPSRAVEGAVSDYVRKYMGVRVEAIPKKPMFVYNTWVPFTTHIDAKLIRELADAAAECGIEEFVIDDGWQINISDGKYGRGDWAVDEKKFPGGLKPTFDYIKSKGMRPGLWLSLAWADPSSAPMKEHPEWFVKDKAGNLSNLHTMNGNTRTACMATPWREYIRDRILGLVRDHGLAYVKLDLAIATSAYVYGDERTGCYAKDHPGHAGHEDSYAEIYASCMKLFDELHEAAPDLFIDCTFETAGKTFLMDYGIAKHAEGNWLSNIKSNEDGQLCVRSLAWGRTPALPATSLVIGNLHMNGPRHLLAFKSLAGTLPIMLGDPRQLTPDERAEYREWSGWLKGLEARHAYMSFRQDLPGFGEPQEGTWDGFSRINTETKSGGLVGVFRHNAAVQSRRVTVRGLDPEAKYVILKGAKGECWAEMTGRELEEDGFEAILPERCDGELYEVRRQERRTDEGVAKRAREALFPLSAIRLTGGPLQVQQEQNRKYLLRLAPDRLLSRFRSEAGLEPKAEPYNGWESPKLRLDLAGHILGFYMAGAAMTVEATGDEELKKRLLYIVDELDAVQNAHGDGYALAVKDGRKVFAEVASGKIDVQINPKTEYGAFINGRFEPIYTMNKILLGLWRIYLATDSEKAKGVFLRLSDWFGNTIVEKLDDVQLQKVLDCEHGSLPETFAYAFQMTGDEKYRRWARRLCHERMLAPLADGNVAHLCFHHANNEIPKFTGFERVYRITGEERLHRSIVNAWNAFASDHAWANGGNSHCEHLFPKEDFAKKLFLDGGPESCNSVNMLRQTEALFETEPSAGKIHFYERVLFDHLLSTHDPILGRTIYYTPPKPGASRTYSDEFDSMWCCTGTGFEAPGKYGQMVFTHAPDERAVAVQLFAPATLDWKARGVKLHQETAFPYGESSCVKIEKVGKDPKFTVKVRRPFWAGKDFAVYVNGARVIWRMIPDGDADVCIEREWKAGDRMDIEFPMSLRAEYLPGSKKYVAFFYGPTLLVGDLGSEGLKQSDYIAHPPSSPTSSWRLGKALPMPQVPVAAATDPAGCLERTTGGAIAFRLKGSDILLKPIYDLHFSRYTMYWRLAAPEEEKAFAEAHERETELARRAVDSVLIGDAASETAHGLAGENTEWGTGLYGEYHEYKWRHAGNGGFFSFRLAVGDAPGGRTLVAKYLARERGKRMFDVLVDGKMVRTENLVDNKRSGFVFTETAIPAEILAGKKSVEIRFVPKPGNTAGGLFGLWLVRP